MTCAARFLSEPYAPAGKKFHLFDFLQPSTLLNAPGVGLSILHGEPYERSRPALDVFCPDRSKCHPLLRMLTNELLHFCYQHLHHTIRAGPLLIGQVQ